ncbi:MAG: alpha/beta hydrolase [Gammaproteobacteria bacterium]|nr:alpha/beta hydrolase [Gammaproteobacteria bacterium]
MRGFFDEAMRRPPEWAQRQMAKLPIDRKLLSQVNQAAIQIAGVHCIEVTPKNSTSNSTVVYLHGGAYVMGSPASYSAFTAQLAVACGARMVVPDYRLSPAHRFPAAQEDCLAVTRELLATGTHEIILMGDSAGGALAANTALALQPTPSIKGLVLLSPWVEPTASGGTMISNDAHDVFSKTFLDQCFAMHIGEADAQDPRVNLVCAELAGLPKTYVQSGGAELFHDQIAEFAERAKHAGADLSWDVYPPQFHVFQALAAGDPDGVRAIDQIAEFVIPLGRTE